MHLMLVLTAAVLALGACSSGTEPTGGPPADAGDSGSTSSLAAVDNEFEPTELELAAGEEVTVTFTNEGEAPHTFTSEDAGFDTGMVEPGQSAEVTFTAPDKDVPFVCTLHEESDDMVGTIVVQ